MGHRDVVAIGGSTGSIDAVKDLLARLPADFPAAILIVIHVGTTGRNFLAGIFDAKTPLRVETAVEGEAVERGRVYVAPADYHLLVVDATIRLGRGPRENLSRPAIDPLFRSVAINYGPRSIALVLTGMLDDGAAGLNDVKRCGGITVVQNPADAPAPDMPLNALRANDVDYRASLAQLPDVLRSLVGEDAGTAPAVPDDIRLEVEIARGRPSDTDIIAQLGEPVALSCPTCGGVLSQMRREPPMRFRCQVGHAFTAEALGARQEGSINEAVLVALRIIEERAGLTEKLAENATRSGLRAAADRYHSRVREYRSHADILKQAAATAPGHGGDEATEES